MSETEHAEPGASKLVAGSPSVELSANRTSLSFERTRMSADRTLMGILRTSLSLITFGFTIYEAFHQLEGTAFISGVGAGPALNFGFALILLGVLMLILGIVAHLKFQRELEARRVRLFDLSLLHTLVRFHATPTFIVAFLLLLIGLAAAASVIFRLA